MTAWEETFGALRQVFLAAVPERLAQLSRALDALEAAPEAPSRLEDVVRCFHGFAGSGTTYGFPTVSALGAEGEEEAAKRAKSGGPSNQALLARLRRVETALAAELAVR